MAIIAQEYIQEGYEKGMERGMIETKKNIARHLLASDEYNLEAISNITGLSIDEVSALRDHQN